MLDATQRKGWGWVGHVNVPCTLHMLDATQLKGWGGVGVRGAWAQLKEETDAAAADDLYDPEDASDDAEDDDAEDDDAEMMMMM